MSPSRPTGKLSYVFLMNESSRLGGEPSECIGNTYELEYLLLSSQTSGYARIGDVDAEDQPLDTADFVARLKDEFEDFNLKPDASFEAASLINKVAILAGEENKCIGYMNITFTGTGEYHNFDIVILDNRTPPTRRERVGLRKLFGRQALDEIDAPRGRAAFNGKVPYLKSSQYLIDSKRLDKFVGELEGKVAEYSLPAKS